MGENSKIEWTHHTFNSWEGCEKISPGCANCYAERRDRQYHDGGHWGPNGTRKTMSEAYWRQPVKWNLQRSQCSICKHWNHPGFTICQKKGCDGTDKDFDFVKRPRVFCSSLADVFEQRENLVTTRFRLFNLIRQTPNLDWLVLTKRPQNILPILKEAVDLCADCRLEDGHRDCAFTHHHQWLTDWIEGRPPRNVWLGTSVEDQQRADERIPELLKVSALVRFLSCEPLLGPIDLRLGPYGRETRSVPAFGRTIRQYLVGGKWTQEPPLFRPIDWVIAGGESGPNARPAHPDWFRSLRDQCNAAGVAFHFKQFGEYAPIEQAFQQREMIWINRDGRTTQPGKYSWNITNQGWEMVARVGKKAAGRILDGRTWDEVPEGVFTL